jgi:hypothetical protein
MPDHSPSTRPRATVENLGTKKPVLTCPNIYLSTIHTPYYDNALS